MRGGRASAVCAFLLVLRAVARGQEPVPVAFYTFDGPTGTEDSAGSHPGTLAGREGGATIVAPTNPVPGKPAGNRVLFVNNPVAAFNDQAQRMSIASHADFNFSNTMTIAMWVCPLSLPPGLSKGGARVAARKIYPPNWTLQYRVDTRRFSWQISSIADASTPDGAWNWNEWCHLALVYDSRDSHTGKIYVNAVEQLSRPANVNLATGNYEVLVGCCVDNTYATMYAFHGWLDDVRFYATALTQTQIRDLMRPRLPTGGLLFVR